MGEAIYQRLRPSAATVQLLTRAAEEVSSSLRRLHQGHRRYLGYHQRVEGDRRGRAIANLRAAAESHLHPDEEPTCARSSGARRQPIRALKIPSSQSPVRDRVWSDGTNAFWPTHWSCRTSACEPNCNWIKGPGLRPKPPRSYRTCACWPNCNWIRSPGLRPKL